MSDDRTTGMITSRAALEWLSEAARYFENRDTRDEDSAHWANVRNAEAARRIAKMIGHRNAEAARRIAKMIGHMDCEAYEAAERLDNAERRLRQLGYERCSVAACNCKGYHFNDRT